jgi:glutamate synthase (NADPH/NADH) small chain
MGKVTGFLQYGRVDPKKRPPLKRILDFDEIRLPQQDHDLQIQGARCMNCGIPFCMGGLLLNGMTAGCPLHNLIPEWNDLVYKGQWKEAYQRLIRTNPFPEFTSRICPAPCEGSCTEGYHLDAVAISSLEYQIIEKAFTEGWVSLKKAKPTGKKVAIVGSGPSGLSAAHYLNMVGHDVTVYERSDKAGGLLMYGIPNMKLDKKNIERRLDLMRQAGITFILNTEVGIDIPAHNLIDSYDAVVLCGGATKARGLEVPGKESIGVHFAVDYLKENTQAIFTESIPSIMAKGKDVVILGGGDTGTDCVATCLRQGCASVVQFEIMPKPALNRDATNNPWPEWPKTSKTDYGQEEAIAKTQKDPRNYLIATKRIGKDEAGRVHEVHSVDVRWEQDAHGRFIVKEISGSERIWKADLVLLAMGFLGPEDRIADELKLDRDSRSNYKADYEIFASNQEKVFIAGDMRRGQSLVVWAIQEGKLAAREVDRYLMGKTNLK